MKSLILNYSDPLTKYKCLFFRPDRWFNTGTKFLDTLSYFIDKCISEKVNFVTLKELLADEAK
jgi:hypothetical protein